MEKTEAEILALLMKAVVKDQIAGGKALADLYFKRTKLGPADRPGEVGALVTDCISDLMHYAHANGCDAWRCAETAHTYLQEDLAEAGIA